MATHVALLRGINVGRNRRLAMADLRALLAGLGLRDVTTHLNSGNALFSSTDGGPALETAIEAAIDGRFGMPVRVLVRSREEIDAAVRGNPLLALGGDGSRMLATFLSRAPEAGLLAAHDPTALDPGRIAVGDRVIYQWCPDGFLAAPPVAAFVEKNLLVTVSARNWNTVTRLAELMGS